jgi:hypothetical protein
MAKFYEAITDEIRDFIAAQKVFFTATAPREGRINLSPKGLDTFRVLDSKTVGYLDLTGSGNETAAHLADDGRLTIMMCGFDAQPLILRLYGRGQVVRPRDAEWESLRPHFPEMSGERQIILLHIESLQTSCGFAVPVLGASEERRMLLQWSDKKGADGVAQYQRENNQVSIDGLPTHLFEG